MNKKFDYNNLQCDEFETSSSSAFAIPLLDLGRIIISPDPFEELSVVTQIFCWRLIADHHSTWLEDSLQHVCRIEAKYKIIPKKDFWN